MNPGSGARVAVVTGGARGLGAAICRALAAQGADVAVWDRDLAGAEPLLAELAELGRRAIAQEVDVAEPRSVAAAANEVRERLGPVGILVNNAGISPQKPFLELAEEDWDRVLAVNLKGAFFCTRALVEDMIAARWGRVVNISSSSAQSGTPGMVHYAASKGGVIAFTKALARELAPHGITVNNVAPSTVLTDGLRSIEASLPGGLEGYVAQNIPVGRIGQPEDIAHAVAFLAHEASGYITGVTLSVNGGRYML